MVVPARVSLAAVCVVLATTSACVEAGGAARYVEREDRRFAVSGRPDVVLSTFNGAIEIRTTDRPEVLVTIEKRATSKAAAADIAVRAEQTGNRVVVDARSRTLNVLGIGLFGRRSARLIVSLPASSDLRARSGDGTIDVEHVNGRIDLGSGDGNINARDLTGEVRARTGDGSVRLDAVNGGVDVGTGDGDIGVRGRLARVRVRSGDGRVTIHAEPGSATASDWDIASGDGSVTLELPDGFGGELVAHSGDGSIHLQNLTVSAGGSSSSDDVRGRIGPGGRTLHVRTGDGAITLRRF